MSATAAITSDSVLSAARTLVQELFGHCEPPDFSVRFWDNSVWRPPAATSDLRCTLVINHPGALRVLLSGDNLRLGEAYIYDAIDVEGDIEGVFTLADALMGHKWHLTQKVRFARLASHLPVFDISHQRLHNAHLAGKVHSFDRDRRAIHHHYDISNEFYRLWLDDRMVYSCAYFQSAEDDLGTAQLQKLDYICRKLRLQPGERFLDVGCGWGALIIHAALNYGVNATGITLSREQAQMANERIRKSGLNERCRVEIRDYRELDSWERFDKIASVGMFEHVGEELLPEYFERTFRLLRPGGVFLNHGIARAQCAPKPKRPTFISTYVFPDGDLVPISTTMRFAEAAGFELRDLESLREHYSITLHNWLQRLQRNADAIRRMTDEVTYRIFRLYLSGSAHWFATARNNVHQALLAKPDRGRSGLPLTRADWYTAK